VYHHERLTLAGRIVMYIQPVDFYRFAFYFIHHIFIIKREKFFKQWLMSLTFNHIRESFKHSR